MFADANLFLWQLRAAIAARLYINKKFMKKEEKEKNANL